MKVTILGTGNSTGIPLLGCDCKVCKSLNPKDKRWRSSILIEVQGKNILIDTSADFRGQMIQANVKRIDAVLFTHYHRDHTSGLDDLRAYNFIQQERLNLYANLSTSEALKHQYPFCFSENEKIPNTLDANLITISHLVPLNIQGLEIIPIKVMHHNLEVFGYRIEDFTYITDVSFIEKEEQKKILGTKVLVLSALRKIPHHGHFTLHQAVEISKKWGVSQVYFTHISHQMGLHNEINKELPKGMQLSYDNLEIHI